ncbi:MAG: SEC-C metal-binding domain-containing protein, partial [Methylomonas sp.]|nr:SEC-C metal-binding domain-containing protein [Methylomonas sp.]
MVDADRNLNEPRIRQLVIDKAAEEAKAKETAIGADVIRHFEKSVMLQVLDNAWKEHLAAMDQLRQGIHLRGYAQKDPKQEYKREAFQMFNALLDHIKSEVVAILAKVQVTREEDVQAIDEQRQAPLEVHYEHAEAHSAFEADQDAPADDQAERGEQPYTRAAEKVGRNDPCPCGSGKKYKQCHGKLS